MSTDNRNGINELMPPASYLDKNSTLGQVISDDGIGTKNLDSTIECAGLTNDFEVDSSNDSDIYPAEHGDTSEIMHCNTSISPTTCDNANSTSQSCTLEKKERASKRTMLENAQLQNTVLNLYQQGHPTEAIAHMCKVRLGLIEKITIHLLRIGKLPSCPPKYAVLSGGKYIKDIVFLNITKANFVSITPTDDGGVILKPFNTNGEYHE